MPRHGNSHQTAHDLQKILIASINDPRNTEPRANLVSAWEKLERLKREMRGLPPLRAASVKEVLDSRQPKRLKNAEPVEA